MGTFLFDKIIFGPVKSRRLGVSLGVNLLPTGSKVCSFDCIYCECGWNPKTRDQKAAMPGRQIVAEELRKKLKTMQEKTELPDVITFAGNGEPTLHPQFEEIIDDTIALRNQFAPTCRIAVLSNATRIHCQPVFRALQKIEANILKLDSAIESTLQVLNCPVGHYNLPKTIERLQLFGKQAIIQTLFVKGKYKGQPIDNTTEDELTAWLKALKTINPKEVMIYTIDRETPTQGLKKVSLEKLKDIAKRTEKAGFEVQVSG